MQNFLFQKIKLYHVNNNLLTEGREIPAKDFNPYYPERFCWNELPSKNLLWLIEPYKVFFDFVKEKTRNTNLKQEIEFANQEKDLFTFEEIS